MPIELPYKFEPREYQKSLFRARQAGKDRFVCVWHRRCGKDKCAINFMMKEMVKRKGSYFYFLPTYRQGRKIIWDGMDKDGLKFTDHIPKEARASTNNVEMKIELLNGSVFQVVGGDNYDSIVGTNPVGCVFSEYSLTDPRCWEYIRPILIENGGWALFIGTPRGKNHFYDLLVTGEANDWFTEVLTVEDTKVVSREQIEAEIRAGMTKDLVDQEFYCSFSASSHGAYYADDVRLMRDQKRFCSIQYDPQLAVHTAWDLGMDDSTSIIFFQLYGKEIRIIDYEEHNGEALGYYVQLLEQKGYKYGNHYLPHDIEVREMASGRSRRSILEELGMKNIVVAKRQDPVDGIAVVRSLFARFWVNSDKCGFFLEAVSQYRREYNEALKVFRSKPLHDWTSHCCDALRVLCSTYEEDRLMGSLYVPEKKSWEYAPWERQRKAPAISSIFG